MQTAAVADSEPDGFVVPVEERVDPAYVEAQIGKLASDLKHIAYAPGWSPRLSRDEQIEAMKPSRPVAHHINPELLRLMPHRKRALAAAGQT